MQTAAYSLPSADLGRVQTWQRCLTMQCCTILSTLDSTHYSTQYSTLCLNEKKTVVSAFSKYCNIVRHPSLLAYMSGPACVG